MSGIIGRTMANRRISDLVRISYSFLIYSFIEVDFVYLNGEFGFTITEQVLGGK